jgi:flagellin-like hook-associated protein FlgL
LSDNSAGTAASASNSSLSGGVTTSVHTVNSVKVNGATLFSGTLNVSGNNSDIAQAIVNANTNSDYNLSRSGNNVVITSATKNTSQNGFSTSMTLTKTVGATTASSTNPSLAGGLTTSTNVVQVSIAGTQIHDSNISVSGGNSSVAEAIKNAVNGSTTSPDFTASRSGTTVTFTSATKLTDDNSDVISMNRVSGASNAASASNSALANGDTPTNNQITSITVDGTRINNNNINHTGNNSTTATAIANEINATTSNRNYTASASGTRVTIYSDTEPHWQDNGNALSVSVKGTAGVGSVSSSLDGSIRSSGGALTYINNNIQQIIVDYENEIQDVQFQERDLFTGNSLSFQTGTGLNSATISTPTYNFAGLDENTLDITVNAASTSITYIDNTMADVMGVRSEYAAFANRLESEIDYLSTSILNNSSSLSKIMDTDLAVKTLQLTKNKVLENAALFALAKTAPQKGDILALYYDNSRVVGQGDMFR